MGNLRSVQKAFESVGAKACITQSAKDIEQADKIVLPGVGAMQPAMESLKRLKLISSIKEGIADKKPFLGICLGLQLLFEESDEGGSVKGLGILKGNVQRFKKLKVPHMGWNTLNIKKKCPLLAGIKDKTYAYFCHSYYVKPASKNVTAASTDYGIDFTSMICQGNIFGVQFHPEKSQDIGLAILKNFAKLSPSENRRGMSPAKRAP